MRSTSFPERPKYHVRPTRASMDPCGTSRSADNDLRRPQDLVGQIHADSEPLTGALREAHAVVGDALVGPVIDAVAMLEKDATFEQAVDAILVATETAPGVEASRRTRGGTPTAWAGRLRARLGL